MSAFIELLKSLVFGIVQGITEWLPISSTGHLILIDEFLRLDVSEAFKEMFDVVIQLGSILAVIVLYFGRLWPLGRNAQHKIVIKKNTLTLWLHVIVGAVPAGIVGILLDDWFEANFFNFVVVAIALAAYGVLFIVIERAHRNKRFAVNTVEDITYTKALEIGCFQILALIPGTSRSGSTILGASLLGVSRVAAAEFSFFMAVPVMFGASFLKLLKFGFHFSGLEFGILAVGFLTAFLVSLFAIRFLMDYVRRHSFEAFGWYRIILGTAVILYYAIKVICLG